MDDSRKNLNREGLVVAVAQILCAGIYAFGFRFISEVYSPADFGEATLLLGIVTFAFAITLNPLLATHLRFYPDYRDRGLGRWFDREVRRHLVRIGFFVALLGLAATVCWSMLDGYSRLLVGLLLVLQMVGQSGFTLETDILSAARQQGRMAKARVARVLAYPLVAVGLAYLVKPTVTMLVAGAAISYWLPWLFVRLARWTRSPRDRVRPSSSESTDLLRAATLYGGPFLIIAISTWVSALGDRYILALHLSTTDVGIYAAIYGLFTQPYFMLAGGLANWLRPVLFDLLSQREQLAARALLRRWLIGGLVCGFAFSIALWLTRGLWLGLFLAPSYHHKGSLILYLLIANTMHVGNNALSHHLMAAKRTASQVVPLVTASVANIALNLVLIPSMGLDGAGLATAISFTFHFVMLFVVAKRTELIRDSDDEGL